MIRTIDQDKKTMSIQMTGVNTQEFDLTDPVAVADILTQLIAHLDGRIAKLESLRGLKG